MAKQTRTPKKKVAERHRARKPRPVRPLDLPKADNHAARHAAKKERRARHEELMARQAEEKAARLAAEQEGAMKTSERLVKVAEQIREARRELARLMVELPAGQTLEVSESVEARLRVTEVLLETEASQLRLRFNS